MATFKMNEIDLMSYNDLVTLSKQIANNMVIAKDREKAKLAEKIEHLVRESGLAMAEIFNKGGTTKGVYKYRNPKNVDQKWTGHGRKPNWLINELAKGAEISDFEL